MIQDHLGQSSRYTAPHPRFAAAFDFLANLPADLPAGRTEIDGTNVFALVQRYTTRAAANAVFEAHRQYIDVQFVQAGRETILWAPLVALAQVTQPYDAEKDVAFFAAPDRWTPLRLEENQFAILFPDDAHAPCLDCAGRGDVPKVVIKARQ